MFFKKLFSKSVDQLVAKGDLLFAEGRYADSRQFYLEALEKKEDASLFDKSAHIQSMLSKCGNSLAKMNLDEAEAAIRAGNSVKAAEHIELSLELADDVSVREKAEKVSALIEEFSQKQDSIDPASKKHDCSSCSSSHNATPESVASISDHLHEHEQFQLLVNTLPGDLPERYCSLGEEFATAYMLAHFDDHEKALNKFRQLLSFQENDIILYETSLLEYKRGDTTKCESLLRRALQLNDHNPLCNLSIAQLFVDTGRLDAAVAAINIMIEREIFHDQAQMMLADVYILKSDFENALQLLSAALQNPALKKPAAERLVHILAEQGRDEEAVYLAKTYLKGCC